MLTFFGSPAFTSSRLSKRLARVQKSNPNVTDLDARYVHFVDVAQELNSDQTLVLERLLQYGPKLSPHSLNGSKVLVTPRLGTISSWSSKATDIAHICGLHAINRIERAIEWTISGEITNQADLLAVLHDRMTETVLFDSAHAEKLFHKEQPKKLTHITLGSDGKVSLQTANKSMGLALSDDEIDYLLDLYSTLGRDPTDVELMMFAQANSEHCRHKIFNAEFTIDGEQQGDSLFRMIRRSTEASPRGVLSAYKDNAAVIEGPIAGRFFADPKTGVYATHEEPIHILMKVETHNHPTAISPHPGASTGSGGEIRDEGATGIGAKPKAGLVGFSVSNLHLPEGAEPWEAPFAKPNRIASALDIMLEGPIGAAAFNNEFGRPAICGYFRTYELLPPSTESNQANTVRGYHKPIMIAGGLGNIRNEHVQKGEIPVGAAIVVLGGPAMLIGLGGGAASSMASGSSHEDLDFASVQRDNAEMQRRSQEVIDRCWALGHDTPIASIHDVGAGGLSNALPELVHESRRGALFDLRKIPSDEPGMSPLEIWCNEAQERYVLAVFPDKLAIFEQFCKRERAPFAVLGHATNDGLLKVEDHLLSDTPIQMPLQSLLGKPPRMKRNVTRQKSPDVALNREKIELKEALVRVLRLPTVADKTFLITIGDRTVTGLVHRDPMVGPWQVPVADTAVTATSYDTFRGEAMAMGERPPVALLDAAASARMAVAEAITNICAAKIASIGDIKLSANWMAPAGHPGEDARLYEAVKAVGSELCPALGIAIPVGKDSMSMKTVWADSNNQTRSVVAPLSLIVSAFAPVSDIRKTLTPQCRVNEPNRLMLIDLGQGKNRLGASCLAQVYQQLGTDPPDLDSPDLLKNFFMAIQQLNDEGYLLAYHDRADGGLLSTLTEMAFASNAGLDIVIDSLGNDHLAALFSEELGAVIQVREKDAKVVIDRLSQKGLGHCVHSIGSVTQGQRIQLRANNSSILDCTRTELRQAWSHVTYKMQALRDNPECAEQEHLLRLNIEDTGIFSQLTFNPDEDTTAQFTHMTSRPRVAILREQGVNGHIEMAAAFDRAGFESVDVHMTDILEGRVTLDSFRGLVACGGFSYGDVLGAGEGWAKSILFNQRARQMFKEFFERENTFSLGVCNGCQMFSALKEIVPGTTHWPRFVRNRSEQFEARLVMVKMQKSPSLFFKNMEGSVLPIPVAHGEGLTEYANETQQKALEEAGLVAARYVDHSGSPTELYPRNPNGSAGGITAICNESGRVTILMPHPERVFRAVQYSWHPQTWKEDGPWMRMFRNARAWVG